MPRNEFADHPDEDYDLVVIRDDSGTPIGIEKVLKNHPGKGEDEVTEVEPVEADHQQSLAELRREPGATTTAAHIAEINAKSAATD